VNVEYLSHSAIGERNLWLLSPPCQPHTRTSNARCRDAADVRSAPLRHVTALLATARVPPAALVLENVAAFIGSAGWLEVIHKLRSLGYSWQAYLLTPMMFGVPNSRPRVFLVARRAQAVTWRQPALCGAVCVLPPALVRERPDLLSCAVIRCIYACSAQQVPAQQGAGGPPVSCGPSRATAAEDAPCSGCGGVAASSSGRQVARLVLEGGDADQTDAGTATAAATATALCDECLARMHALADSWPLTRPVGDYLLPVPSPDGAPGSEAVCSDNQQVSR
jgi:C-5 cytosine-specific DNA methylase